MAVSNRPPKNAFVAYARKVYNPVGFSKGYNFVLFFIFWGAFFAFTLSRLQFLDFNGTFCPADNPQTNPDCFYWLKGRYTAGMILHLGAILPGSLLACVQFLPFVRHKAIMIHRVNGYVVITLALVANAGAFMILDRTFGGGIDVQTAGGALGVAFTLALVMAYINIKRLQIEQHRAWMLRAWFWAACIITNRLIFFIVLYLPGLEMHHYALPCDKIAWLFGNQNATLAQYPACEPFFTRENLLQHAAVRATVVDARNPVEPTAMQDSAFGMCLWLAFVIHVVGVEIYLHLTPAESERLRQVSYQRQLEAGMRNPGSAGLTSDRLGDCKKWSPSKTDAQSATAKENASDIELQRASS